ncbi:family 43 glycosylhydrolase [Niabella sp. CC-SYL272]|uniref:family 43 glycosylhydrolase n=1 Tax=Niabella agricola TaxID=2891571 RepID=UPI001F3FB964|nr:family 43 glycosylhydrolase [Niabella agricola]MCF3107371.1 family 43 glycosylhydrolase [Niabella agricola]
MKNRTLIVKANSRNAVVIVIFFMLSMFQSQGQQKLQQKGYTAYLFTYFTGNQKQEEAIRFAISADGYHYWALNGNQPVLASEAISTTGGVRDPHILRGADQKTFYMVATDMVSANGWNSNRAMVLMRSTDLINWSSSVVNIPKTFKAFENVNRVWAPQTIYDPVKKKYMIYWSMRAGDEPDVIYYAYANKDFTALETAPLVLFHNPHGTACIDGDIVFKDGKYYLFFKTEGSGNGIKIAVSDQLTTGYTLRDQYVQQTSDPVEGAGVFKLNDGSGYILMYDVYTRGRYQFTKTSNFKNFKVVDADISMNFHPRHGTVLPITTQEAEQLAGKWLQPRDLFTSVQSKQIRKNNIVFDTSRKKLYLPVLPGTPLRHFDPGFTKLPGVSIAPAGPADFSKGPVRYAIKVKGHQAAEVEVHIVQDHNPVLNGYYADPEILYAGKTKRFYIYPTSDGFTGWSGNQFKAFSSPDLLHWKDEGVILDLPKQVSWAGRNAWAPCIIEKKTEGRYQYFYYFTAAQKIGVAVADHPTGPFTDLGKPLVAEKPPGVKGGQEIDPDVFTDPQTSKSYLYWGNGYMAVAELNADMVSLKPGTTRILTPDRTFREGTYVFYRKGVYYFMWSENDTRSPDYRVRYGTATTPLGPIHVPENNVVLQKKAAAGIYGTGHHSVLQLPGTDRWYIVYHRFTYPNGMAMGEAAGYHREVCIDTLEFNADGNIREVKPSHLGVGPVHLK